MKEEIAQVLSFQPQVLRWDFHFNKQLSKCLKNLHPTIYTNTLAIVKIIAMP